MTGNQKDAMGALMLYSGLMLLFIAGAIGIPFLGLFLRDLDFETFAWAAQLPGLVTGILNVLSNILAILCVFLELALLFCIIALPVSTAEEELDMELAPAIILMILCGLLVAIIPCVLLARACKTKSGGK